MLKNSTYSHRKLLTGILFACVATTACKKKEEKGDDKKPDTTKSSASTPKVSDTKTTPDKVAPKEKPQTETKTAPEKTSFAVDEDVSKEIAAIVAACEVTPKNAQIKCANGEDKKLFDTYFGYSDEKKDRVDTISAAAKALADSDPKVQTVAAKLLGSKFNQGWGDKAKPGSVDKAVSKAMRDAIPGLSNLGQYQSRIAITATVYASSLSDDDAAMHEILSKHPDEYTKLNGWKASMVYGRLKAFDKVKALASGEDKKLALAAVTAAKNMPKFTDEEKAQICPWAVEQLGQDPSDAKESDIFEQAGYILTRCSGEYADKLLDWGEAQLKKGVFDRKYYFVYRELCHSIMKGVVKVGATPEQCDRNFKFLEKVTNDKKIEAQNRAYALDAISYSRRDAKSMKVMKKYKNSKVPEIKKAANDSIKMLESYVKKK